MTIYRMPGFSASIFAGNYTVLFELVCLRPNGGSCSTEVFGEILLPKLDRGEVIIDPVRFVADPDMARCFPDFPM